MRSAQWVFGLVMSVLWCGSALAGTVYDSGGFESPRFTPGPLTGQDGGAWVESGSGATAIVQAAIAASGSQSVEVTRASGDSRFFPQLPVTPVVRRFVLIDWDMSVARTQLDNILFGPFFGIEAYTPATRLLGGAGVDATTGDVLYEAPGTGVLTETGAKVAFDQFNHFQMAIDNGSKTVSIFVNKTLVKKTSGFVDASAKGFADADLSALAAATEPPNQPGTAHFDNYIVRTSDTGPGGRVVALPSALWPSLGVLFVTIFFRRRLPKPFFA